MKKNGGKQIIFDRRNLKLKTRNMKNNMLKIDRKNGKLNKILKIMFKLDMILFIKDLKKLINLPKVG